MSEPPERMMPQVGTLRKQTVKTAHLGMGGVDVEGCDFVSEHLIELQWGYGEGFFRHFYETPETLTWEYGKAELDDKGVWTRPKKTIRMPWPMRLAEGEELPEYFSEFLEKLERLETYLDDVGSVSMTGRQIECRFCRHVEQPDEARSYILKLDAFETPTEMWWPSIYWHYLGAHRVLPSRMFAMMVCGRRLEGVDHSSS